MTSAHAVVVVGSANADLVLDVDHRPAPGETVLAADVVTTPGGKGANQAVAAGRLGGDVAFVGCVGADEHGALLRGSLASAGVDLAGVRTVDAPTGTAIIMVTPDGENSIIVSPGANWRVTPVVLEELRPLWQDAPVVVVQLEIPPESVALVATQARGRVVLNAAPAVVLPPEVLAAADPLVVNESEARLLLGAPGGDLGAAGEDGLDVSTQALAVRLLQLGPRSAVLTLGSAGAVVAEAGAESQPARTTTVPAHRVQAVDTTGAGDSFVGALAVRLATGATLPDAVTAATAVAAVTVTRRGAQESFPTVDELKELRG
jgi:ribokinase